MNHATGQNWRVAPRAKWTAMKLAGFGLAVMAFVVAPDVQFDKGGLALSNNAMAKNARGEAMAGGRTGGHATQAGRGDIRSLSDRGAGGFAERGNRQSSGVGSFSTAGSQSDDDSLGLGMTRSWRASTSTEVAATGKTRSVGVAKPRQVSGGKIVLKGMRGMKEVSLNEERQLIGNWDIQ